MASDKKTVPVTVIKKLGSQSPSFDLPVKVQRLDGTAVEITLNCKALRKSEWAKLRDENQRENAKVLLRMAENSAEPVEVAEDTMTAEQMRAKALDAAFATIKERGHETSVRDGLARASALVLAFATGWELEDAFSAANLCALDEEFGGFLDAAARQYDQAIYQGRLGN